MLQLDNFFDKTIERDGNEAEAVLLIAVKDDGRCTVNIAGVDRLMIGKNAVSLTAAMKDTINTKLFTASKILEIMEEKGKLSITRKDFERIDLEGEDPGEEAGKDKPDGDSFDDIKEFLTGLAEYILGKR